MTLTDAVSAEARSAARDPVKLLEEGNLPAAEVVSRIILQENRPAWPQALAVLSSVAASIGFFSHAARYLKAQREPTPEAARALLNDTRNGPSGRGARPIKGKFLIALAWGCGLWSDLNHVLGCAQVAEVTRRQLLVHWGAHSLYNDANTDVFSTFFESDGLSPMFGRLHRLYQGPEAFGGQVLRQSLARAPTLIDALRSDDDVIISDRYIGVVDAVAWSSDCLWPDQARTAARYRRLFACHLKAKPILTEAVAKFVATRFEGRPFAAVHLRGTDKRADVADLDKINTLAIEALRCVDPAIKIFAMTDDISLLAKLKSIFPDRIITADAVRSKGEDPIHVGPGSARHSEYSPSSWVPASCGHRARLGFEVLFDSYVAAAADTFIGNGRSNVSGSIALIKNWGVGKCILVAPNQLLEVIDWGISV